MPDTEPIRLLDSRSGSIDLHHRLEHRKRKKPDILRQYEATLLSPSFSLTGASRRDQAHFPPRRSMTGHRLYLSGTPFTAPKRMGCRHHGHTTCSRIHVALCAHQKKFRTRFQEGFVDAARPGNNPYGCPTEVVDVLGFLRGKLYDGSFGCVRHHRDICSGCTRNFAPVAR